MHGKGCLCALYQWKEVNLGQVRPPSRWGCRWMAVGEGGGTELIRARGQLMNRDPWKSSAMSPKDSSGITP